MGEETIFVKIEKGLEENHEENETGKDEEGETEATSKDQLASRATAGTSERQTVAAPAAPAAATKRPAKAKGDGKGKGNAPATQSLRRYVEVLPCATVLRTLGLKK